MRLRNWDVRLFRWADRVVGQPFKWGVTDCGMIVRTGHIAMCGEDSFGWPPYKTKLGATKARKQVGGIPKALRTACHEVGRRFAQSGDIVLIRHKGEYGMGIVVGLNVVGAYPGCPVTLVPLGIVPDDATFWRVP